MHAAVYAAAESSPVDQKVTVTFPQALVPQQGVKFWVALVPADAPDKTQGLWRFVPIGATKLVAASDSSIMVWDLLRCAVDWCFLLPVDAVAVRNATTRYGRVSFRMQADPSGAPFTVTGTPPAVSRV